MNEFWQRKAERRSLPPKMSDAMANGRLKVSGAAGKAGKVIRDATPEAVKNAGGLAMDRALESTIRAALGILELTTETVQEFTDAEKVLDFHRAAGRDVHCLSDLGSIELEHLDQYTRRLVLRFRSVGLVEGGAMGALTFIPVAGSVAAVGADLVVMHALSTAIATRAAHAYGIDPTSEGERHHLDRMLRRAWASQAPKATAVKSAKDAFQAGSGRVRWSKAFRDDHRIAAAMEQLMKQVGNTNHVPIEKVVAKMPAIGVVTSAGMNSAVLGSLARTSIRYGQTVHLARKHGLEPPPNLR